jgi:choice-of-anchor A domain-containing protein
LSSALQINRVVEVMILSTDPFFYGDTVYGGGTNPGTGTINSNRVHETTCDPDLDLSEYVDALAEIKVKSQFWSQLPANGNYLDYFDNPPLDNEALFSAGDDECIQVFHLTDELSSMNPRSYLNYGIDVKFDSSLVGKTIIINVKADSDGNVWIQKVGKFHDSDDGDFNPDFTASILWNFYDAKHVTLGTGEGFGDFQGTILVPNGELTLKVPGTNGGVIVGGDVTQDFSGGGFHSYEFDPVCPLPLPNCTYPADSHFNSWAEPFPWDI